MPGCQLAVVSSVPVPQRWSTFCRPMALLGWWIGSLAMLLLADETPSQFSGTLFTSAAPQLMMTDGAGEGPAWHFELGLFTSGPKGISRRALDGTVELFRPQAGSNGLLFDRQGRLLICEPAQRRVTRCDVTTGELTVLADQFHGHRLNSPNDIALDAAGRIYFTDPRYGPRDDLEIRDADDREVEGVYRIDLDGTLSRIITHEVDRPNGLIITANDRNLYVADNNNNTAGGARKLWRFDLQSDGSVDHASRDCVFDWKTSRGPDGMALDRDGRLYVAAGLNQPQLPYETVDPYRAGIYVFDAAGQRLGFVPIPRDEVTNCAFGGVDQKTLFITAGGTLWSIPTTTAGWLHWPPSANADAPATR